MPQIDRAARRRRVWFAAAAAVALAVSIVFIVIGDGVDVPDATGLRRLVVDAGHAAAWVLLTAAFAIAAVAAAWVRVSQWLAVGALVLYLAFLFAVFLWP